VTPLADGGRGGGVRERELLELVASLLASSDTEATLRGVASFLARHLAVDRCSVIFTRTWLGVGHVVVSLEDAGVSNLRIRLAAYPEIVRALELGRAVRVDRGDGSELFEALASVFEERHIGTIVVVPLAVRGEALGVLFLRTRDDHPGLDADDLAILTPVAQVTAIALREALREGHSRASRPRWSGWRQRPASHPG
jgi:GAF domain-containing protein